MNDNIVHNVFPYKLNALTQTTVTTQMSQNCLKTYLGVYI